MYYMSNIYSAHIAPATSLEQYCSMSSKLLFTRQQTNYIRHCTKQWFIYISIFHTCLYIGIHICVLLYVLHLYPSPIAMHRPSAHFYNICLSPIEIQK